MCQDVAVASAFASRAFPHPLRESSQPLFAKSPFPWLPSWARLLLCDLQTWSITTESPMPSIDVVPSRSAQALPPQMSEASQLRKPPAAMIAASDAVMITDKTGAIVWVNLAFTKLTGFTAEEAVGRSPGELIQSGFYDQPFYRHLWATILSGRIWRGELTNRRKDGSFYHEDQTITPIRNADGDITHFVAVKRDLALERQLTAEVASAQKVEVIAQAIATEVSQPAGARCFSVVGLETILVVGHEDEARNFATGALRSAGYRVLAAARGTDALTLLDCHRGRLDLLMTDVVLPDMSGRDLANRVIDDRPAIQVLYTSRYIDDQLEWHDMSDDVAHFIGKPYTASSLTHKVREVLDLQRRPKVA
jgi:PAS domain S-box-containing protein